MFELVESRADLADCLVRFRRLHRNLQSRHYGKPEKYPCLVHFIPAWHRYPPCRREYQGGRPLQIPERFYEEVVSVICYRPVAKKIVYPQKGLHPPSFSTFDVIPGQHHLEGYISHMVRMGHVDEQIQRTSVKAFYDGAAKVEKLFPCLVASKKVGVRGDLHGPPITYVWEFFLVDVAIAKLLVYAKKNKIVKTVTGKVTELTLSYAAETSETCNSFHTTVGPHSSMRTTTEPRICEAANLARRPRTTIDRVRDRRINRNDPIEIGADIGRASGRPGAEEVICNESEPAETPVETEEIRIERDRTEEIRITDSTIPVLPEDNDLVIKTTGRSIPDNLDDDSVLF